MIINIEEKKKLVKWQDDIRRRNKIRKALDFYENNHEEYIKEKIDERLDKREAKILKKYYEFENLTETLIGDMSLIFREEPLINQKDKKLEEFLSKLLFISIMRDVNKLVNLTYDVGILPQIRDGKVELDIITADNIFVHQKLNDPTKADMIGYQVGIMENTNIADRIDIYHVWNSEGKFKYEIDENGNYDNIEKLDAPDYQGEIPIIIFRNYIPRDSFFYRKINPIVEKNEQIDLRLTSLNMLEDYNLPQRVNIGVPQEQEIKQGITFSTDIPINNIGEVKGDSKYINPQAPVSEEWEIIEKRMIRLAHSLGLSADSIKGAEYTSGYHYALSKQEIIQKNKEERKYYRQAIKDLMKIIFITANELDGYNFNINQDINIDFGEIIFEESPETKQKIRAMEMNNGTKSVIDFIMEDNPDYSREQAIEKYKQIKEEKQLYQIGTGIEEAMGIEK